MEKPPFDSAAPLQFVLNGSAGSSDTDATRDAIESALRDHGRMGEVQFAGPGELANVARDGAARARRDASAVIAVGGDGTISTVAQSAYAAGSIMAAIPEGTFNYFAREHGVPETIGAALPWLFGAEPEPVQISAINDHVFLVNASIGLYPDLLQDRESWKARFGRSRLVAFSAGLSTLLRAQRRLDLSIDWEGQQRRMLTLTLFVGNNQLQLEQLGLGSGGAQAEGPKADGHITAVILKPVGTLAMLRLMMHGALGQLGIAEGVERIVCEKLTVNAVNAWGRTKVKVAFDGEVSWMHAPLTLRVLPKPLWLLKSAPVAVTA